MARDCVAALFVSTLVVLASAWLDDRRSGREAKLEDRRVEQQEIMENLRFVREVAVTPGSLKPFRNLDLRGTSLSALDLSCAHQGRPDCASFQYARFDGADLSSANLRGADLANASFRDYANRHADLSLSNLTHANLSGSNFERAKLAGATLTDAEMDNLNLSAARLDHAEITRTTFFRSDLRGANMEGAYSRDDEISMYQFEKVCYDDKTVWPTKDFSPPPPACVRPEDPNSD